MNKDNIKGKMDDIGGRIKRQTGEWTGDEELQSEGAIDQAKGKARNAWGNVKEGARDLKDDVQRRIDREKMEREKMDPEKRKDVA